MNAVFLEADHDSITRKVHQARRLHLAASGANPQYHAFSNNATSPYIINLHALIPKFNLISGLGHGNKTEFCGQNDRNIWDDSNSQSANHTVAEAIVHLYSCECGAVLGPYLVRRAKARAFIGYTRPVSVPGTQATANEFVRVAAVIDKSILAGDSAATTKRKADAEAAATEAALRAPGSSATPREVALFKANHAAMVGPWTSTAYGSY